VSISYEIQKTPDGTAFAVRLGRNFVEDEDFAVMYGDNFFRPIEVFKRVNEFHERNHADATIVLKPVKEPSKYGIAKTDKEGQILKIIEKPSLEEAKDYWNGGCYFGMMGLLLLKPLIFDFIEITPHGKNGETWLTDSVEIMRNSGHKVQGFKFEGYAEDIGTYESLINAVNELQWQGEKSDKNQERREATLKRARYS
jgi:glucose-1-phosphate thymidylyltransferase